MQNQVEIFRFLTKAQYDNEMKRYDNVDSIASRHNVIPPHLASGNLKIPSLSLANGSKQIISPSLAEGARGWVY
ncbi:hypothetical protein CQA40_10750 [Helicobacter sp. MIT 01-3238]|nr:hypothetical protein CQA40_10750 [Helicobacter sp. MIT 01-3238]